MSLHQLNQSAFASEDKITRQAFGQFEKLLNGLNERELPEEVEQEINDLIDEVNAASTNKVLKKLLQKNNSKIIQLLEKKLKLVPKNHYRNLWLAIGMAVFGIPLGLIFALTLGSMAYIAIGLPIGLALGIAVGAGMDKKALDEDRQFDFEV